MGPHACRTINAFLFPFKAETENVPYLELSLSIVLQEEKSGIFYIVKESCGGFNFFFFLLNLKFKFERVDIVKMWQSTEILAFL